MIPKSKKTTKRRISEQFSLNNKVLKILCEKCSKKKETFLNDNCINCIFEKYNKFQNKEIKSIYLNSFDFLIDHEIIIYFENYKILINELKRILKNLLNFKTQCNYKDFKCNIFIGLESLLKTIKTIQNPIIIYNKIIKYESEINHFEIKNYCKECFKKIKTNISLIKKKIANLEVIKKYKNYNLKKDLYEEYTNFYDFLFTKLVKSTDIKSKKEVKEFNKKLIEDYKIQKYGIYKISIYELENEIEKKYVYKKYYQETINQDYFNKILIYTYENLELIKLNQIVSIENLINSYYFKAIKKIDEKFKISNNDKKKIALLVAIKILNLNKIFALLLDDNIEEIFLDSPYDKIYINHKIFGRCRTLIDFTGNEIERIKTFLRLYSGKRLDYSNPNIKFVLSNKFFYCRFTCDIAPINFKNFSLDIRKLNKNIFTIQDLLYYKTLSPKIASFLYYCILKKINITVTGKTDSGKTTLINSLDLLTPKEFRKIYIENAIESLDQHHLEKHQLKFEVDSLSEENDINKQKSGQIKKLLHRTPDIIYLGEILTQEECHAMFHCLTVGLKGFQTIHSNGIDSLINRFLFHFQIEKECLNDLDIIILMGKDNNRRIILSINQVYILDNKIINQPIFRYNSESDSWIQLKSLFNLKCIEKIHEFENISKENFDFFIKTYEDFFIHLKKSEKRPVFSLVKFFDKISFLSKLGLKNLATFRDSII